MISSQLYVYLLYHFQLGKINSISGPWSFNKNYTLIKSLIIITQINNQNHDIKRQLLYFESPYFWMLKTKKQYWFASLNHAINIVFKPNKQEIELFNFQVFVFIAHKRVYLVLSYHVHSIRFVKLFEIMTKDLLFPCFFTCI